MSEPLVDLLRYNRWANLELFHACRTLTEEQLDARSPGTSGSVRVLLTHIAGGQQTLILRTHGRQHEGEMDRASVWPGIDVVTQIAESTSDELIAIAERLAPDAQTDLSWQGKVFRFPTSFFLTHAVAHGAEHRTEIKVTLGALGVETPDLDGWPYSAARGYGTEI